MIKFPQLFKQQINYIEKASKEHDGAFWNSKSVKPLRRKMILCFEALDSDHVSWIIWFRSRLQSIYRESFDIDRDVRAASRDVFIPTGNKSNSAEAGINKPEGGNPPPYKYQQISITSYRLAISIKSISHMLCCWSEWQQIIKQQLSCLCDIA